MYRVPATTWYQKTNNVKGNCIGAIMCKQQQQQQQKIYPKTVRSVSESRNKKFLFSNLSSGRVWQATF